MLKSNHQVFTTSCCGQSQWPAIATLTCDLQDNTPSRCNALDSHDTTVWVRSHPILPVPRNNV